MSSHSEGLPSPTWAEVCAGRLDRHTLATPPRDTQPAGVVGTICGEHAQVMSAAHLCIGLHAGRSNARRTFTALP
jgi:hypothetical protein